MKQREYRLEWDYTELAETYSLRPRYAPVAIDRIVTACDQDRVVAADIGAGTGHLTIDLLERGCSVDAVEPNDAMRAIGTERTSGEEAVRWFIGIGEETGLRSNQYHLVSYGSSFSNTDQPQALREACRVLRDRGWFACLWNHRQLDDPLQAEVEELIRSKIPDYRYGLRRDDHAPVIEDSGLFGPVTKLEEPIRHRVNVDDWLTAWRSHATLQRQAGGNFSALLDDIDSLVRARVGDVIEVPYVTVGWLAQRRDTSDAPSVQR